MIVKLLTEHYLEFLSLKGGCSLLVSKYHIVGKHMSRLINVVCLIIFTNVAYETNNIDPDQTAPRVHTEGFLGVQ